MDQPHTLLLKAAARLHADGHADLGQDIHVLARRLVPAEFQQTIDDSFVMPDPTEPQLMQLYRDWWKASYGAAPNAQATLVAAAFARHVLAMYGQGATEDAESQEPLHDA